VQRMPEIDLRYLFRLTDDTGIFQHAALGIPDPSEGYTTDDNARALILADMLYERYGGKQFEDFIVRYLSFLLYAKQGHWFRNFMNYNREFTEKRGSEDCYGRSILALAYTASRSALPSAIRECAKNLLDQTISFCKNLKYPKAIAYTAVGLSLCNSSEAAHYRKILREKLIDTYTKCRRKNWHWFEEKITYCSGILPYAILSTYSPEKPQFKIGLESLDFLSKLTFRDKMFLPIGCNGWMKRGGSPAVYDEQPVEACNMMLVCMKAYETTGSGVYLEQAKHCFQWYLGRNISHIPMIDPETGGCRDGLSPFGANKNEGAESLICWLISALVAEQNGWYS
jgi:hypothetical protein